MENYDELQLSLRSCHVGTDLVLLAFPLVALYQSQMSMRKNIAIGWIFCFGIVCCVSSIMPDAGYEQPPCDLNTRDLHFFASNYLSRHTRSTSFLQSWFIAPSLLTSFNAAFGPMIRNDGLQWLTRADQQ